MRAIALAIASVLQGDKRDRPVPIDRGNFQDLLGSCEKSLQAIASVLFNKRERSPNSLSILALPLQRP
ncbi:MAG: hypothetical protein F6J93_22360 [Oscillatoria sp. SIO1A7]|nr:hypothetical protein [Oscillatoria sp. SIO1A7]